MATMQSPHDFTVAYTSASTLTVTGCPITVDNSTTMVLGISYSTAAGALTRLENGKNNVVITSSANVISVTVGGAAYTGFAATDIAYRVTITAQAKAYDPTTTSLMTAEVAPLNMKYLPQTLIDTTNTGVAGTVTVYYPSTDGMDMAGFRSASIQYTLTGGVSFQLEALIGDATTWVNITKSGLDLVTNTKDSTSRADCNGILFFDNLNVSKVRAKTVTTDATNTKKLFIRQRY
jgi:hypothetical protein